MHQALQLVVMHVPLLAAVSLTCRRGSHSDTIRKFRGVKHTVPFLLVDNSSCYHKGFSSVVFAAVDSAIFPLTILVHVIHAAGQ